MKYFKLVLITLVLSNNTLAQLSTHKKLTLLNNGDLYCTAALSTQDSGFILSGYQGNPISSVFYKVLCKYDLHGNYSWCTKFTSGNSFESVNGISETNNNDYLITGQINSSPFVNSAVIHKVQNNGIAKWKARIYNNFSAETRGQNSIELSNFIYTSGTAISQQIPAYITYLFKLDTAGNLIWRKIYTNTTTNYFKNKNLIASQNGNLILTGTYTNNFNSKSYLMQIDTAGNIQWVKTYTNVNNTLKAGDVLELSNGNFLLLNFDNSSFYLTKTDSAGNIIWCKNYYHSLFPLNQEPKLIQINDNDFAITESFTASTLSGSLVLKFDSTGSKVISYSIGQNLVSYASSQIAKFGNDKLAAYTYEYVNGISNQYSYLATMENFNTLNGNCNVTALQFQDSSCSLTVDTLNLIWINTTELNYYRVNATTVIDSIVDSTLCITSSINYYNQDQNEMTIIPNPCHFYCSISALTFKDSKLKIYDISGRPLLEKAFDEQIFIDASTFITGIYIIEIKDKKGRTINSKLAKF